MGDEEPSWQSVQRVGVAAFDFTPAGAGQIKMGQGDKLKVIDQEPGGWLRGENTITGETGMFPASYVKLGGPLPPAQPPQARKPSRVGAAEAKLPTAARPPAATVPRPSPTANPPRARPTAPARSVPAAQPARSTVKPAAVETKPRGGSVSSPLAGRGSVGSDMDQLEHQIQQVLKEWVEELKRSMQAKKIAQCQMVKDRMAKIIDWRLKMRDPELAPSIKEDYKRRIIRHMEGGRRLMGLDMMPRTSNGEPADEMNTGLIDLLRLHRETHDQDLKLSSEEGAGENAAATAASNPTYMHIYLDVKQCIVSLMEPTVYYFSLQRLNAAKDGLERITDDYVHFMNAMNAPCHSLQDQKGDLDLVDNTRVIFANVPASALSLSAELFLVCRMYRYGKIVKDDKPDKKDYDACRRPYGASVIDLIKALPQMDEQTPFQPPNMPIYMCPKEDEYVAMPYTLAKVPDHGLEVAPRSGGIAIGLQLMRGELGTLVRERAQELKGVCCAPMLTLEEMKPGLRRHDMYVTMESCSVLQGGKKTAKNVQVSVMAKTKGGETISNVLSAGTTSIKHSVPAHSSAVEYHNNSPVLADGFVVRVQKERMMDTHLFFELAHASSSKKAEPFSFSFAELMSSTGTAIADGVHEICTYKMPPKTEPAGLYLRDKEAYKANSRKESLTIRVKLCSTEVTQNQALNDLLRWKENKNRLEDVLTQFSYVDPKEMLKFVSEILDALFGISSDMRTDSMQHKIFKLLVQLLNTFGDEKQKHHKAFKPLLDQFIKTHVSNPAREGFSAFAEVHMMLVKCIDHHLERRTVSKELRETMKGLRYIFQIMINSRIAFSRSRKLKSEDNQNFKRDTTKVLTSINMIMKETGQMWLATQAITIRSFDRVFADLVIMYYPQELGQICQNFFKSITDSSLTTTRLKLNLLRDLCEGTNSKAASTMFSEAKFRAVAYPPIHQMLLGHLLAPPGGPRAGKSMRILGEGGGGAPKEDPAESQKLVIECMQALLRCFERKAASADREPAYEDKAVWAMLEGSEEHGGAGLLQFLIKTVCAGEKPAIGHDADFVVNCGACLVAIIHQALPDQTAVDVDVSAEVFRKRALDGLGEEERNAYVADLLRACRALFDKPPFPKSWVVMGMTVHRAIYKVMAMLSRLPPFSEGRTTGDAGVLWRSLVGLTAELIQAPPLQLENFSQVKQTFVKERYGDLREPFAQLLLSLWQALGQGFEAKRELLDVLLKPAMLMSLTPNQEVGEVGRKMYSDLLIAEYEATHSFATAENFTIDSANEMVESGGKEQMMALLDHARQTVEGQGDAEMSERVGVLIHNIEELVKYLERLNSFPSTPSYETDRSLAAMKLITYLEQTQRDNLRTKIVRKLANEIHEGMGVANYVEAGIVLMKFAQTLEWAAGDGMREKLLQEAIDNLDRGKEWERCIAVSSGMREYYQSQYMYGKISGWLTKEADWYRKIVDTERFFASYYRVEYVPNPDGGSSFGPEWAGNCYVLRGGVQEDLRSFMDKMLRRWPDAKVVLDDKPAEGQDTVMVNTVTPSKTVDCPPGTPDKVVKYMQNDLVDTFTYQQSKRVKDKTKGKDKTDNEFQDLWTYKYYFTTQEQFPQQVRCSKVAERRTVDLCPIESAIMNMNESYDNLSKSVEENKVKPDRCGDTADLSRYLGGMIDAAVNGGPRKYAEAFFVPAYLVDDGVAWSHNTAKGGNKGVENHTAWVAELKQLLVKISKLIPEGLKVHERLMVESFKPLQEHLEATFAKSWIQDLVVPISAGKVLASVEGGLTWE